MTPSHIIPLSAEEPLAVVGGKGRSLGHLKRAGFTVPDGFVLTTRAYRDFIALNEIQDRLETLARSEIRGESLTFAPAADRIARLFADSRIPDTVTSALRKACDEPEVRGVTVAVRSSATAEDLPEHSFAGQHDTFLNVSGFAAILEAIRKCWTSAWSSRAMGYRHERAISHTDIAVAVVVQRMVAADVSGVLFTANPVTGERAEMVVNASYGLGEAIVGGEITPDTFVIDRASRDVTSTTLGAKARMVAADGDNRTKTRDVPLASRETHALTSAQLRELAAIATEVEASLDGRPQDIEWLHADGAFVLVQSRPITGLPPPPLKDVRWEPPEPGAYLGRSQLVEHIPDPVSPLFEDLHMRRSLQHFWGRNLVRRGRHDYVDTQPPYSFVTSTTVNGYAYRHLGEPPRTGRPKPMREPHRRTLRLWFLARLYLTFVPRWRYGALSRYRREIRAWSALRPAHATAEQLLAGIRALSMADARYWYDHGGWNAFSLTRGTELQLQNFLDAELPGQFTTGQLLSGLASPAVEAHKSLWRIAAMIRDELALLDEVVSTPVPRLLDHLRKHDGATEVVRAIDAYLDDYGHQIYTLDFAEPSHGEDTTNVMRSLLALVLRADYDPDAAQRERAIKRRRHARQALNGLRGRARVRLLWRLWVARWFYPNREEAMFHMGRAWTMLRPFARELGRRLTEAGTLSEPDDVFYLRTDELTRAVRAIVSIEALTKRGFEEEWPHGARVLGMDERVAARRALRAARRSLVPPTHIPAPPVWARQRKTDKAPVEANELKGAAVSPGRVTAEACVILSPAEFGKMRPGTILVCPTTTPAWTQLFPLARGLVTDIGGVLAHGSIVCREYGIPGVLGVGDATSRIADGASVTVDGDRGVVVLHEGQSKD